MFRRNTPTRTTSSKLASTARKTTYVIKDRDLGGIFMWELSQDYNGTSQNLMTAMYKAFARASGQ